MPNKLYGFALVLILGLSACSKVSALSTLEVGIEYYGQQIGFGETQTYSLGALESSQEYEVRISSPGLYAAEFFVTFVCDLDSVVASPTVGRKLLNVEKTMFKTDSSGRITRCPEDLSATARHGVQIYARLEGFTTDKELLKKPVSYNIMLEKVWFGVPDRVVGVLVLAAVLVIVIAVAVLNIPVLVSPLSRPLSAWKRE